MRASLSESSGRARSFQAVEDQVQAEAELGAELVARLQDVFNRELGEVRITGAVAPAIDRTFPLFEVAAALRVMIDGTIQGKVVITLS